MPLRGNRDLTLLRIIAIMLGRLEMDVTECIQIYKAMFKEVFGHQRHKWAASVTGQVQARFDETLLRNAIQKVLIGKEIPIATIFEDGEKRMTRT
jgi:hypothetical protein